MSTFNGLGLHLGNLSRLSHAKTRSISPENFTGEKGNGGKATEGRGKQYAMDLGEGWKISPSIVITGGQTRELANINGPGAVQQIWLTGGGTAWRHLVLRIYWDGQEQPSVECPLADFFASGWGKFAPISSLPVCVNPGSGLNCYWEMPFRQHARITLTNISENDFVLYYQINYTLTEVPEDAAYFHAQFRRSNPLPYKQVHPLLDNVHGQGHYVGTAIAWGVNNNGWWGEGEIKFYIDGDKYPSICGTGTEDYFCGSYNFENKDTHEYQAFNTPYAGLPLVLKPDGLYQSQMRFGMYRWHIMDPIRFDNDLRVTIQALGWRGNSPRYLPLQDDIASVAYWYQTLPTAPFPELPDADVLEII
jgi:hypothetical protein